MLLMPVKNEKGEVLAYLMLTNAYDEGQIDLVRLLKQLTPAFAKKLRDATERIEKKY